MPPRLDRCVTAIMERADAKSRWPDPKERKQHAFAICRASTGLSEDARPGFLIDLSALTFDESGEDTRKWIHLMPVNQKLFHPRWGELEFTPERIQQFHENHEANVRGVQLDIDYEHKEGPDGGRAAGWIEKTEVRDNGLWGLVDFTKKALDEIKQKMWKYFSPEFDWEWTSADGKTFSNVLFGGALTNRPFLKTLAPINLSEHIADVEKTLDENDPDWKKSLEEEVDGLDPKVLRATIGLKEDASDDEVLARLKKLSETASMKQLRETLKLDEKADENKILEEVKALQEKAKPDPEQERRKKFAEEFPEEAKQLEENRIALREERTSKKLEEFSTGKIALGENEKVKGVVPPAVHSPMKDLILSLNDEQAKKFDEVITGLMKTGLVQLGEIGSAPSGGGSEGGGDDAVKEFAKKCKEEQESAKAENNGKGISFNEAVRRVSQKNPKLTEDWRAARDPRATARA